MAKGNEIIIRKFRVKRLAEYVDMQGRTYEEIVEASDFGFDRGTLIFYRTRYASVGTFKQAVKAFASDKWLTVELVDEGNSNEEGKT